MFVYTVSELGSDESVGVFSSHDKIKEAFKAKGIDIEILPVKAGEKLQNMFGNYGTTVTFSEPIWPGTCKFSIPNQPDRFAAADGHVWYLVYQDQLDTLIW